jgi:hypothetical protein
MIEDKRIFTIIYIQETCQDKPRPENEAGAGVWACPGRHGQSAALIMLQQYCRTAATFIPRRRFKQRDINVHVEHLME